jgi:2,5-dihydroxypyridine 5,6-dioxygenase
LKSGEKVLILCEPEINPLITAAFLAKCREMGSEAVAMNVSPLSAGGWLRNTPGDLVVAACKEANLIIALTYFELAQSERTFYHTFFGTNTRVCSLAMAASPGCLIAASKFPMKLFFEISKKVAKILRVGKNSIRFTTSSGTNLEFVELTALVNSAPLVAGGWDVFPPIGINFLSKQTNGTLVFDESSITGVPTKSIVIDIRDNYVEKISGGVEAERDAIEAYANGRYFVRHAVIGLHPKIRTINAPQFERARAAGVAYVGLDGTGPSGKIDRTGPGFSHLDCILNTPSVFVDDEFLVKERKLLMLSDPEIVEMAKAYGDPRKLLAQNPFFW